MSGLNLPKFQPPSGPPPMRIDNSHVSENFMKGKYDFPIVQKVTLADSTRFRINTSIDKDGNVGETGFDFRR